MFLLPIDFFPERLKDLNGKTLTATSFDFPPYNYPLKDTSGKIKGWDGAEYRLTEMIGRSMNFEFELKTPTDGGLWGWLSGKSTKMESTLFVPAKLKFSNI